MSFDRQALDRHITGNWGEDQFRGLECSDPNPLVVVDNGRNLVECVECGLEVRVGSEVDSISDLFVVADHHRETGL